MKYLPLLLILVVSTSFAQSKKAFQVKEIIPLEGVDPSLPSNELTPLMTKVMNGTSILGIGESVHGSKQMLQMQQRLIQNAIETQDVRLILWESNLFRTKDINQYLQTCQGDIIPAIQSAHFMTFEQDLSLFDWICKFNQSHSNNPVRIVGVDIYNFAELNHQWVIDKTSGTKNGPQIESLLNQTTDVCIGHGKTQPEYMEEIYAYYYKEDQISPIRFEKCNQKLQNILKLLETNDRISGKVTDLEYAEMRVYVRNLLAMQWYWLNRFSLGDSLVNSWKPRDSAMAENVMDFWKTLNRPKSIFLAHTSHVSKFHAPFIQTSPDLSAEQTQPIYPAGTYIQAKLGSLYKVIGFTGFDIDGPQGDFAVPTSKDSLDLFIHKHTQHQVAWIDLEKGSKKFDRHWWLQHENGGKSAFKDGVWMNPTDHYDALIYIERSEVAQKVSAEPSVFQQLQREPVGPINVE
ncbi:MAG: erythromycin esterase family protein [Bdellovibrionota bacterium]